MCSILVLGLELSPAGPQPRPQGIPPRHPSAQAPETTFTDNVIVNTGFSPSLILNQNTTLGNPAQTWQVYQDQLAFIVGDATAATFPFSIYHGAPSDSLNITNNGNAGLGVPFPSEAQKASPHRQGRHSRDPTGTEHQP